MNIDWNFHHHEPILGSAGQFGNSSQAITPAIAAHFPTDTYGLYSGIPVGCAHDCQTVMNEAFAPLTSGTEYPVWSSIGD